jgi:hypothetical protein
MATTKPARRLYQWEQLAYALLRRGPRGLSTVQILQRLPLCCYYNRFDDIKKHGFSYVTIPISGKAYPYYVLDGFKGDKRRIHPILRDAIRKAAW